MIGEAQAVVSAAEQEVNQPNDLMHKHMNGEHRCMVAQSCGTNILPPTQDHRNAIEHALNHTMDSREAVF